jgi:hypothetical protein
LRLIRKEATTMLRKLFAVGIAVVPTVAAHAGIVWAD